MAQAGFTPIQLYYSSTASAVPTAGNLIAGELALNTNDGKLYFKNSSGLIRTLADSSVATGNLPGGSTGSVVYQSATGVTAYLPIAGAGSLLYSNGTAPAYASIGTAGAIVYSNGTAPTSVALGSTGSLLYSNGTAPAYAPIGAVGSILYSNGTIPTSLPIGALDYVLTSTGTIPQFVSQSSLSVGTAATAGFATNAGAATTATSAGTASNLANGAANQIVYQSAPNTSAFVSTPTISGTVLGWNGSAFAWVSAPAATTTANISGGAQYQIPFQANVGSTTFSANLTYNSSTNTFGTGNITATGTVAGDVVSSTTSVSAGTTLSAGSSITAGTSINAGTSLSATTSITGATITATESIAGSSPSGAINYGTLSHSDTNIFSSYATTVNSYAQKIIQNKSNGNTASVDFVVANDLGTATSYYGDFGMNSSTYSGVGPFQAANVVYLYSIDSDLVVGTKSAHYLRFVTNDNSADSMTISPNGAVAFNGDYGVTGKVLGSTGTAGAPIWVDAGGAPPFLLINAGVS